MRAKQKLFLAEYLKDLDGPRAAIAAGYSAKSAESYACQLLAKPEIAKILADKAKKKLEKAEISSDWVLSKLKLLAEYDPRRLFDANGNPIPVQQLDESTAQAITGIETTAKGGLKYRTSDRIKALELLGKYFKLFTDQVELSQKEPLKVVVRHIAWKKDKDAASE